MDEVQLQLFQIDENLLLQIFQCLGPLDLKRVICVNRQWKYVIEKYCIDRLRLLAVTVSGTNELALVTAGGHDSSSTPSRGGRGTAEIVQRIPIAAPRVRNRKRYKPTRTTASRETDYCWPTCMALSPQGESLFVSQYKINGVMEFNKCPSVGFVYRRTLMSGYKYAGPEGIVVAHDSLYICSVTNGTVSRVALNDGRHLETAGKALSIPYDEAWTLWGMCISPDQRCLYIAGHVGDDDDDYRTPTRGNSGAILRLDLEPDGSFRRRRRRQEDPRSSSHVVHGYYVMYTRSLSLNRPSNPQFCRHGALHVSSFLPHHPRGNERRVYKIVCAGTPWQPPPPPPPQQQQQQQVDNSDNSDNNNNNNNSEDPRTDPSIIVNIKNRDVNLGWLEVKEEDDEDKEDEDDQGNNKKKSNGGNNTENTTTTTAAAAAFHHRPWGVGFSMTSDHVYITCEDNANVNNNNNNVDNNDQASSSSTSSSNRQCLVRYTTCGCSCSRILSKINNEKKKKKKHNIIIASAASRTGDHDHDHDHDDGGIQFIPPGPIPCGTATTLIGEGAFQQPNQVIALD